MPQRTSTLIVAEVIALHLLPGFAKHGIQGITRLNVRCGSGALIYQIYQMKKLPFNDNPD